MRSTLVTPVPASRLAVELGASFAGDDVMLRGVSMLSAPKPSTLTFATRGLPADLPADVCVISAEKPPSGTWIRAESPRLAFVKALHILDRLGSFERSTEPARIDPTATIGPGVAIGKNVVIGARTRVSANVTIGDETRIGADCFIKSGSVIGDPGFGFERDEDGTPIRMLHFGGVVIGDRVEVGSLDTVVCGTLGPTVVEDDVKIDDHVHVGHNVRIGKKALVTACAELGGGVVVGEAAWIGPNVSILERVTIGDRAFVGLGAVVLRDVAPGVTVVGNPARVLERKK